MNKDRIYSFIGLAKKAGRVITGEDGCERAVKAGDIVLIIVAENASDNTRKKFSDMCNYRGIDFRIFGEKDLLGRYTGKDLRAIVGITDNSFAKRLIEMIDQTDLQNGGTQYGKEA